MHDKNHMKANMLSLKNVMNVIYPEQCKDTTITICGIGSGYVLRELNSLEDFDLITMDPHRMFD